MKIIKLFIILFVYMSMIYTASATDYYIDNAVSDGSRPYQFSVNISDSAGTNNATHVYLNGSAGTNFSTVYFTDSAGSVTFPHCTLNNSTGLTYVNATQNGTIRMWYGNTSKSNSANCTATFIQYEGSTTTNFLDTLNVPYVNVAFESNMKPTNAVHDITIGLARGNTTPWGNGAIFLDTATTTNLRYIITSNASGTDASVNEAPAFTNNTDVDILITLFGSTYHAYVEDNEIGAGTSTRLPASVMGLYFRQNTGTARVNYAFVRNYVYPELALTTWGTETEVNYLPIYASSTLRYQNDTEESTTAASYTKVKENNMTESYTGSWTITFDMMVFGAGGTAFGKIYKNGVAYGTEQTSTDTTYTTYSETFTGISIVEGDTIELYAYKVGIGTFVKNFRIYFDYDSANYTPTLLTPLNNSVTSFNFPPQFTDVDFTWSSIGDSGYQIEIAEDEDFNLMEYAVTTTTASTTQSMDAGTHYWRVRTYNSGTTGNWSDVFSFTLTESTPSISGTAINGVVFEYIGGVQTPINGASVYLTNSTYTTHALTGSNGYFLFTGLDNTSTYSLYSIKQGYDNSQTFYVTPADNSTTTVNIPMRIYISPYVPNFVFEKFIIRSLFDDPYPGVTVNIYVGSALNPSFTGTTDSMGQVVFQLIKDTYYRAEMSGGDLPETLTFYFYGKEEVYYVTLASGFPSDGDKFEDINATLFVTEINATHANLSLYYSDNSSTTTVINFYAQYYDNSTAVCSDQSTASYPTTLNCTVVKANLTYLFGWNATSSRYGTIQGADVVNFKATNINAQVPGIQEKLGDDMLNWLSILSLIFIAGLFSAKSVKFGVVIVPMAAVIFYWAGTLEVSSIIVHSALILGILAYIRMSEAKVI